MVILHLVRRRKLKLNRKLRPAHQKQELGRRHVKTAYYEAALMFHSSTLSFVLLVSPSWTENLSVFSQN